MSHRVATGLLLLLLSWPLGARASGEGTAESETDLAVHWSATLIGQYRNIPSPENDNDVGGWFDQYEFVPNKSSSVPFELGIRDGSLDVNGEKDSPLLQMRLHSPSSNLGVSGSQIDQPFFNQRIDALGRLPGLDVDLFYRRIRTEQLRLFPNTEGPGLIFRDLTDPSDRFQRDRTGFQGELRGRPHQALPELELPFRGLAPELSLRGGYDRRKGVDPLRIHRNPSNDWIGLADDWDRSVSDLGGGLLVAPGGRFTLSFDFDYQQFRRHSPALLEGDLGYPPPQSSRAISFVPSTNRSTGTLRFNSRLGDRAIIEGGVQIGELEQVNDFTPDQEAAGLEKNRVRTYAGNAAVDLHLVDSLSFNAFFKYDRRENHIQRDTALFNDDNGTQIDPFVEHWQRILAGGELELRMPGANRLAAGVRYEDITRELDFAPFGHRRILPENANIDRNTRIVSLYARSSARPWRSLRLNAELGYRMAPDTGYIVELDDHLYGEFRASYLFPLSRPLLLSAFVRGSRGENDEMSSISGQGPNPAGAELPRSFERSKVVAGVTASSSPLDELSLHASLFYSQDDQNSSLDLSTLPRYWQDLIPLDFESEGLSRFENEQLSFILGSRLELDGGTDAGISYSLTHVRALYRESNSSPGLELIASRRIIRSYSHAVDFEVGHQVREGLRILAGYRFQLYDDEAPLFESVASAVDPFDRSTHQHTVTLGVTLTSDLFARAD